MATTRNPLKRVQIGLGVLAFPTLLSGAWALFAPRSWYSDYGGGAAPPSAFGAYNEHFIQDFGGGALAVGAILVFAMLWPRRDSVRVALFGFFVQAVPHFIIHVIDDGELDRAGYLFVNASWLFGLALGGWVWWMNERVNQTTEEMSDSTPARA